MLVDQLFGGRDGDLAGRGKFVVLEGCLAQLRAFLVSVGRVVRGMGEVSWGTA
jgi:hypothetical protein